MCRLSDFSGVVIADFRCQRRDQHQRAVERSANVFLARLDADDAVVREAHACVGHQLHRLQEIVSHDRIEYVELEVALAAGEGDGRVVAEHLHAHLGQCLRLRRVDLARHDGGAGLVLGERELAQTRARTAAEEADVVGDLEERDGDRIDGAVAHHHGVMRRQRLELVGCAGEGQAGDLGDALGHLLGKAFRSVEPGADGDAALRQLHEVRQRRLDAPDAVLDLSGVA